MSSFYIVNKTAKEIAGGSVARYSIVNKPDTNRKTAGTLQRRERPAQMDRPDGTSSNQGRARTRAELEPVQVFELEKPPQMTKTAPNTSAPAGSYETIPTGRRAAVYSPI